MREADAQLVLLVAAFEEADADGRLLTARERSRATAAARAEHGDEPAAFLPARALMLSEVLELAVPGVQRLLAASRLGSGSGTLVVLITVVIGLASHLGGDAGRIHVLFAPLFGLLAWNLAVYLALPVLAWRRGRSERRLAASAAGALAGGFGLLGRAAEWLIDRAPTRWRARQVKHKAVMGAAVGRYLSVWRQLGLPLVERRLRRWMHLGAAGLAAGAVAGLYVRGLGLEYAATWESTFLDAGVVQAVLDALLAPAAAALGMVVPDVAPLRAPASGDAAPWIHLYALTTAGLVLVPRMLLALRDGALARRLADDLPVPLDHPLLRRLARPAAGGCAGVDVLPYSLHPEARARDALLALLHDHFGSRCPVELDASLDYGDEPSDPTTPGGRCRVLLFSLAQSPEVEVHGRLAADLVAGLIDDARLLVVVDASSFTRKLGGGSPRLDERRRAWDRVLREVGLAALHVDLDRPPQDDALTALSAALHPPREAPTA